ncbi:hypothetical protein D5F01_LYC25244 [Larimichthys crocea]|uniref:Uncharacterized protein n=1 Tax=Larimichthys crocea TaxID=215358 RepID=A0A6G0HD82_LARCR|nr:hypothetical protein D5F01_LYC25244 [Larimichthys crocea]
MAHVPQQPAHIPGQLGSTEPLSSWRSEGPDHTHTTHAHTQTWAPQSLSPPGGQRGLIILTLHTHAHKHTQRNQEEGPDMAHVPPSSLHTSLGKLGSTEPLSSWRSEGPDHTHTTHARTHKHTQRNQEEGPDMAHVPPSSLHTSLGKPGLHRASLLLGSEGPDHTHTTHARTHKHTQRNQEEGPDMAHVPPSSLHTSLGKPGLHRASLLLEQPAHIPGQTWAPQSLSPPGGQRGLIILTLHARTHKHTQRNQEEGPDMAHVPPSSLHTSLGNLGSTEPLSSWRSEGPDHTHTTHARTHKHTQRNQEEGPDMAHVPPSSLQHPWANLGSTEPLSSWRSEGLIILTLHTHAHKHTQRNQEEGPDMAHVPPAACTHPWATWAPQPLPPGGQRA